MYWLTTCTCNNWYCCLMKYMYILCHCCWHWLWFSDPRFCVYHHVISISPILAFSWRSIVLSAISSFFTTNATSLLCSDRHNSVCAARVAGARWRKTGMRCIWTSSQGNVQNSWGKGSHIQSIVHYLQYSNTLVSNNMFTTQTMFLLGRQNDQWNQSKALTCWCLGGVAGDECTLNVLPYMTAAIYSHACK